MRISAVSVRYAAISEADYFRHKIRHPAYEISGLRYSKKGRVDIP